MSVSAVQQSESVTRMHIAIVVQLLSHVQPFAVPRTAARQASLHYLLEFAQVLVY